MVRTGSSDRGLSQPHRDKIIISFARGVAACSANCATCCSCRQSFDLTAPDLSQHRPGPLPGLDLVLDPLFAGRKGGEPRNSASSRRVSFSKLWWRLFAAGSASGSRVGAGGSPFHSGAGRRAGLGAGRRMMLGSITRSFRPPTITRCSILSRRTRMTLRFPSTGRDSITATRAGALRRRSQLSMYHPGGMTMKKFAFIVVTARN
jgi:hypothetical protein